MPSRKSVLSACAGCSLPCWVFTSLLEDCCPWGRAVLRQDALTCPCTLVFRSRRALASLLPQAFSWAASFTDTHFTMITAEDLRWPRNSLVAPALHAWQAGVGAVVCPSCHAGLP